MNDAAKIISKDFVIKRLTHYTEGEFESALNDVSGKSKKLVKNFAGASSEEENLNFLLEFNIAYWLSKKEIDFKYEPKNNGKPVDFYLPNYKGKKIVIEIKNINPIEEDKKRRKAIDMGENLKIPYNYTFPKNSKPELQTQIKASYSLKHKKSLVKGVEEYEFSSTGKDPVEARYKDSILESIIKAEEKMNDTSGDINILMWGCDFSIIDFAQIYFRDIASYYWRYYRSNDQFKLDYSKWMANKKWAFSGKRKFDYFALINRPGRGVNPLIANFSKNHFFLFKKGKMKNKENFLEF